MEKLVLCRLHALYQLLTLRRADVLHVLLDIQKLLGNLRLLNPDLENNSNSSNLNFSLYFRLILKIIKTHCKYVIKL